jgi:class 3 adenylate cyclase/tetratricopeptide (TPR) repeat protein/ribosomal protein L40E
MICPSCGAKNPSDKRFCGDCGSPLAAVCPSCGASNPPDKRFCGDCGTALGVTAGSSAGAVGTTPSPGAMITGVPASDHQAERRLVTVLFADLVGFTPFAEERDAEDVRETLSRYFDVARDVIGRYGGTVEKFIGDAVMAVWGAPTAREDDAERAVRAALELVDAIPTLGQGIRARCGVLTGEAAVTVGVIGEGMVAGDIVNTAARLQSVAEPGTVLVGEATQRAAGRAIAFEPAGDRELKGKSTPIPAWRALRVVAERGGRNRSEALEAPFVGRTDELRLLKDLYHATGREGRARLVSVIGPAGIGKSRLAWEFTKYLDGLVEDVWWHDGRSPAYGDGITFWALGEMIRGRCGLLETDDEATTRTKVAETLARHVPHEADRRWIEPALLALLGFGSAGGSEQLFAAWRAFFERLAVTAPVVMVFEDLHFADPGLLDFIDSLLEWSRSSAIYVVTLARPELLDKRREWGAGKRNFTSLYLEPLAEPAMRELLAGLVPGLPAAAVRSIVARAYGVPLYAVETVRMLVAEGRLREEDGRYVPSGDLGELAVPETLTALIGARLDGLDAEDRALVQDAAVLGQSFTLAGLAAVSGQDPAALEPRLRALVRREILALAADQRSPERGQYAFVQAMIREVAYGTLARRDRKVRHLAAARFFESLGTDELAGALAGHYVAAHRDATEPAEASALATQARLALSGAADRAAALGAHDSAVRFLDQAVDVCDDPAERARLLERAGDSAAKGGRYAQAEELLSRAVALHDEREDRDSAVRATAGLGDALMYGWEAERAVALLEAARDRGMDGVRDETTALLLSDLSRAYMRSGRHLDSMAAADAALAISERLRLDRITAESMVNKASSLGFLGRLQEPIALLEAARVLAGRNGWTSLELRATNNLAATVVDDDIRRTSELGREALPIAIRVGDRAMANFLAWGVSLTRFALAEEWDETVAVLEERLAGELDPGDRAVLLAALVDIRAARSQPVDTELGEVLRLAEDTASRELRAHAGLVDGRARFLRGDLEGARRSMEAGLGWLDWNSNVEAALVEVMLKQGDAAGLRAAAERQAANPSAAFRAPAANRRYLAAALAAVEGRADEAKRAFTDAAALMGEVGWDFAVAMIGLDMAAVLDPADAEVVAAVGRSREIWGRVGAEAWLALLDDALERPPATPRHRAASTNARLADTIH